MGKKTLSFLNDDDEIAPETAFTVNEEFAKRFEHNKKREELQRLQEKHPELAARLERRAFAQNGEDEEESSSEEEDDGEIADDTEAGIFETLLRIRKRDPLIYQKDVKFFEEEEDEEDEEEDPDKKDRSSKKPMYLKDMLAKQAIEHGPELDSDDDDDGSRLRSERKVKVYDKEQEDLRKAFLKVAEETDADGIDFERLSSRRVNLPDGEEEARDEADETAAGKKKKIKKGKVKKVQTLVDEYFGSKLDPSDRFLKEYILNKGWVERDEDEVPSYGEIVGDEAQAAGAEDDEEFDEVADRFEASYNFRFEEPGAERIVGHPRVIDDSLRKVDSARKRQRDAKAERQAAATERLQEEVKQLKNLKKQEIEDKLAEMRRAAGRSAPNVRAMDELLEGDFDPEKWDSMMASAFDDEYYDAEDDPNELFEGREEELANLSDLDDEEEAGADAPEGSFRALQQRLKEKQQQQGEADGDDEEGDDEEDGDEAGDAEDVRESAKGRAAVQTLLEEYYKLDFEDEVGGIKTRFRYKQVAPSTFGLSVADILSLSDKDLNQVISMKKLAPYRDDSTRIRPNYKALQQVTAEQRQVEAAEAKKAGRSSEYKKQRQEEEERQVRRDARRVAKYGDKKDWKKEKKERKEKKQSREKERKESREAEKRKRDAVPEAGENEEEKREKKETVVAMPEVHDEIKEKKEKREKKETVVATPEVHDEPNDEVKEKKEKKEKREKRERPAKQADETGEDAKVEVEKEGGPEKKKAKHDGVAAARLASYAKLTLKRDEPTGRAGDGVQGGHRAAEGSRSGGAGGAKKKEKKGPRQGVFQPAAVESLANLTKAQRKNAKRALKKQALKATGAASEGE